MQVVDVPSEAENVNRKAPSLTRQGEAKHLDQEAIHD